MADAAGTPQSTQGGGDLAQRIIELASALGLPASRGGQCRYLNVRKCKSHWSAAVTKTASAHFWAISIWRFGAETAKGSCRRVAPQDSPAQVKESLSLTSRTAEL